MEVEGAGNARGILAEQISDQHGEPAVAVLHLIGTVGQFIIAYAGGAQHILDGHGVFSVFVCGISVYAIVVAYILTDAFYDFSYALVLAIHIYHLSPIFFLRFLLFFSASPYARGGS